MKGYETTAKRIALGLLVAAFAVPAAQAADRPDNRAGPFGVESASAPASPVRPDDRAGPLGVGQEIISQPTAAVRPDDRPGIRGVGASPETPALRPDDRPGIRSVGNPEPATQSPRPDDRPGPLGVGGVEVIPVSGGNGFDWGDWAIGLVAGLGLALGMAGALILAIHRSPRARKIGAAAPR